MRIQLTFLALMISLGAAGQEPAVAPRLLKSENLPTRLEQGLLQRQFDALTAMQLDWLEYSPRGPVRLVRGDTGLVLPQTVRALKTGDTASSDVLTVFKDLFLAADGESAVVRSNAAIEGAESVLRLSQTIRGLPVFSGRIAIAYDATTLRVSGVSANFVPDRALPRKPTLSARQAELRVPEVLRATGTQNVEVTILGGTYLAYFADWVRSDPPALVWVVPTRLGSWHQTFVVDALSGEILYQREEETAD